MCGLKSHRTTMNSVETMMELGLRGWSRPLRKDGEARAVLANHHAEM